jgi:hypothetical protein
MRTADQPASAFAARVVRNSATHARRCVDQRIRRHCRSTSLATGNATGVRWRRPRDTRRRVGAIRAGSDGRPKGPAPLWRAPSLPAEEPAASLARSVQWHPHASTSIGPSDPQGERGGGSGGLPRGRALSVERTGQAGGRRRVIDPEVGGGALTAHAHHMPAGTEVDRCFGVVDIVGIGPKARALRPIMARPAARQEWDARAAPPLVQHAGSLFTERGVASRLVAAGIAPSPRRPASGERRRERRTSGQRNITFDRCAPTAPGLE